MSPEEILTLALPTERVELLTYIIALALYIGVTKTEVYPKRINPPRTAPTRITYHFDKSAESSCMISISEPLRSSFITCTLLLRYIADKEPKPGTCTPFRLISTLNIKPQKVAGVNEIFRKFTYNSVFRNVTPDYVPSTSLFCEQFAYKKSFFTEFSKIDVRIIRSERRKPCSNVFYLITSLTKSCSLLICSHR